MPHAVPGSRRLQPARRLPPVRAGRRLALLVALAAGAAGACGPAAPGPDAGQRWWRNERRLIPDGGEIFEPASIVRSSAVRSWRFDDPGERAWNPPPPGGGAEVRNGLLELSWTGAQELVLLLAEPVAPEGVDALEVELGRLRRGTVAAEWRRPGEEFAAARRVETAHGAPAGDSLQRYRLPLAGHPEWAGAAVELRLVISANRLTPLVVRRVAAVRETVDEAALTAALGRAWKVALRRDVRNARLAVPGLPIEEELEVPPEAALEISYGLPPGLPSGMRFTARIEDGEGRSEVLLDHRAEPGGGWSEARLDLSGFGGRLARLRLEVDAEGGAWDPRWGFALWAGAGLLRPAEGEPPVAVLASIDTLRADRLSLYGYGRPTSPHLDAWARRRAAVFRRTVAPAPWTLPAHISMFTAIDAHRHGANHQEGAVPELEMLAETLHRAGFTTVAITGGGFVHPTWGFAQGFDSYRYFDEEVGFDDEMEQGIAGALALLRSRADRPLFLFFHTYEVHNPYRARQPWFDRFSDLDAAGRHVRVDRPPVSAADGFLDRRSFTLLRHGREVPGEDAASTLALANDLYDSGVAYADEQLAPLLEALSAEGVGERAVVAVTSDHGEMLGEHGLVTHLALYEENLLVPLVLAAPGGRGRGREIATQVRSVDLAPTFLELLGLPPWTGVDGVSLAPLLDGEAGGFPAEAWSYASASNYGISVSLRGRLKYIFKNQAWTSEPPAEELYDLRLDPHEGVNLARGGDPRLARLRERTGRELGRLRRGLSVELVNLDGRELRGALVSPAVSPFRVKVAAPECATLEHPEAGRAAFRLAPGTSCRLWIEDVGSPELAIEVALDGAAGGGHRAALDLTALGEGVRVERVDGRWRTAAAGGAPATGVEVRWLGSSSLRGESPAETDQALRDQLRALGYL